MTKNLFYIFLLVLASSFSEDNAQLDLKRISETYRSLNKIALSIDYKVFEDYYSSVPKESELGTYIKDGNNTYTELLGLITVQFEKEKILVNANEKLIIVVDHNIKADTGKFSIAIFNSILKEVGSISKKAIDAKLSKLTIDYTNTKVPYQKVELIYNTKTFRITKSVLYYRNKMVMDEEKKDAVGNTPRVEMLFSDINEKVINKSSVFDHSRYVKTNGKVLTPGDAYLNFKVVNQKKTRI